MRWILDTPYMPLVVWSLAIALVVQVYKLIVRAAGVRHHPIIERTLPLVCVIVGAATGAAFPGALGLELLVDGETVPRTLGAIYGVGVGFASSGVFKAVRAALPESVASQLTISNAEERDIA